MLNLISLFLHLVLQLLIFFIIFFSSVIILVCLFMLLQRHVRSICTVPVFLPI